MVSFLTEWHPNTIMVFFSAVVAPFACADGNQFRYGGLWSTIYIIFTMGFSANLQNDLDEYRMSTALGAAGGLGLIALPRLNLWRISKFMPHSVSTPVGVGYIGYHSYLYYKDRYTENDGLY